MFTRAHIENDASIYTKHIITYTHMCAYKNGNAHKRKTKKKNKRIIQTRDLCAPRTISSIAAARRARREFTATPHERLRIILYTRRSFNKFHEYSLSIARAISFIYFKTHLHAHMHISEESIQINSQSFSRVFVIFSLSSSRSGEIPCYIKDNLLKMNFVIDFFI